MLGCLIDNYIFNQELTATFQYLSVYNEFGNSEETPNVFL